MISVLHLYPRELGINGDIGNVTALAKRAQWRSMQLRVVNHDIGAQLTLIPDLVHIGSGPVSGQELVRDDLVRIAPRLREFSEMGIPFLAIAGGWQLLGKSIMGLDGREQPGAGVFETTVRLTIERTVREVWTTNAAGFENFGAITTGAAWPVLDTGSSVATNLHGPFLPMNPVWADLLLERAAIHAGVHMGPSDSRIELADSYAALSRLAIQRRLGL